jgi:hypothetical protein
MTWVHRTIIVPEAHVAMARGLAAGIAGSSGEGMWTTGLSADGSAPATHFISAGLMQSEFAELLDAGAEAIFEKAGGALPLAAIQAMLSASIILSDADPHAAMAEAGLKMVQESM